jgi:hypothetical protein
MGGLRLAGNLARKISGLGKSDLAQVDVECDETTLLETSQDSLGDARLAGPPRADQPLMASRGYSSLEAVDRGASTDLPTLRHDRLVNWEQDGLQRHGCNLASLTMHKYVP